MERKGKKVGERWRGKERRWERDGEEGKEGGREEEKKGKKVGERWRGKERWERDGEERKEAPPSPSTSSPPAPTPFPLYTIFPLPLYPISPSPIPRLVYALRSQTDRWGTRQTSLVPHHNLLHPAVRSNGIK
ncbi:hypothetical protein Pcinc_044108 [Petrolisthes cinctipes]|uniref:Uncharacterized protein n=1 Tax=Petrolisthes cinctipes TaxID=88211 RepID=A0AAE1BEA6_PETCI|nr:hypothetical protein Pcinc_044108 [Petrolisthes cinctipes]